MAAVDQIDVFLASLKRCLVQPEFLLHFYALFMDVSRGNPPEVRAHRLQAADPRPRRSFWVLSVAAQSPKSSPAWGDLPRLAARHSRNDLDIPPGLYDTWLDCLVEAVRRHDREFSPEIEDAWRKTLAVGIEYMRSKY